MASPQNSLEHLTAGEPVLLDTIPFDILTANSSNNFALKMLNRNARQRTFIVTSTLDQTVNINLFMMDSKGAPAGTNLDGTTVTNIPKVYANNIVLDSNQMFADTSENTPLLIAHVDTVNLQVNATATSSTVGNIYIYVVELF